MQREIKFRLWDTNIKTMFTWKQILLRWNSFSILTCPYLIPMQYTGLKDRNGKEIYEGDILKVETAWYKSRKAKEEDKFNIGVKGITYWTVEHMIFSSSVGFRVYGIDRRFNKVLTPNMIFNNNAEVVGNIYDNPELLQEVE